MDDWDQPDDMDRIREEKKRRLMRRLSQNGSDGAKSAEPQSTSKPIHVESPDHFEELIERYDIILADFYADWCGPCQMLEPIVAEIARDTDAVVAKIDTDEHQSLASELDIQGVPTLLLYVNGEPVERMMGVIDQDTLRTLIEGYS